MFDKSTLEVTFVSQYQDLAEAETEFSEIHIQSIFDIIERITWVSDIFYCRTSFAPPPLFT